MKSELMKKQGISNVCIKLPRLMIFFLFLIYLLFNNDRLIEACDIPRSISVEEMVLQADLIVIAVSVKYKVLLDDRGGTGIPPNSIEFEVKEVLKGNIGSSIVEINGFLHNSDDFNTLKVPYHTVRSKRLGGSCFASNYKKGGTFLLFLKKSENLEHYPKKYITTRYTPYWFPLAPLNEQVHEKNDEWLKFIKGKIQKQPGVKK